MMQILRIKGFRLRFVFQKKKRREYNGDQADSVSG